MCIHMNLYIVNPKGYLKGYPWVTKCPHFSHHPTIRYIYGLFHGYIFRWCPIFPKWDIYQPLLSVSDCQAAAGTMELGTVCLASLDGAHPAPPAATTRQFQVPTLVASIPEMFCSDPHGPVTFPAFLPPPNFKMARPLSFWSRSPQANGMHLVILIPPMVVRVSLNGATGSNGWWKMLNKWIVVQHSHSNIFHYNINKWFTYVCSL